MNEVITFGSAKLTTQNRLRILHLFGTEEEMAYQHGSLLGEDIRNGPIPYLSKKFEFELKNDGPLKNHPFLQKIVMRYMDAVFHRLNQHIPDEYKKIMDVLSSAAKIKTMDMLRAGSMPDAMVILSKHAAGRYFLKNQNIQTFGCTSFIANGEMTRTGELMHGRNLDFPVSDFWDRYASVLYCHPNGSQNYCCITSGGIHIPGVTGFNESGLILGIHQLFSTHVTSKGMPIVILCSEVIRKAHNIEEAIQIVKKHKRAGNWGIAISSYKENKAVVIETSPSFVTIREIKGGCIAQSNFCSGEELKKYELFFNFTTAEDNHYRHKRLIEECKRLKGQMDEVSGIALLGDHFDMVTGRTRSIGRTVSSIYNVQAAFFRPEQKKFWISTGMAPANLSNFMELPFDFKWDVSSYDFGKMIEPNSFSHTQQADAMRAYTKAYDYFSNHKNFDKTVEYLARALTLDSGEFAFYLAKGFILLKQYRFIESLDIFDQCLKIEMSTHERALCHLFMGRTLDLMGRREEALGCYKQYIDCDGIDVKLKHAFRKSYRSPYKKRHIDKSIFQFIFSDFLAY